MCVNNCYVQRIQQITRLACYLICVPIFWCNSIFEYQLSVGKRPLWNAYVKWKTVTISGELFRKFPSGTQDHIFSSSSLFFFLAAWGMGKSDKAPLLNVGKYCQNEIMAGTKIHHSLKMTGQLPVTVQISIYLLMKHIFPKRP